MCTSLVTSPALELTRQQASDRWSTIHRLLHSETARETAGRIMTKHNDVSLLSDYRWQEVERGGDVMAFAVASGLEHDLRAYTSIEKEEEDALQDKGFAETENAIIPMFPYSSLLPS